MISFADYTDSKNEIMPIPQNLCNHSWNLGRWSSVSRDYLLFGLPARSRFGEGRCLLFGASPV